MKTCWLCDKELTETREHIIPESMGGRKTVRGFICRDCNSETGHGWDAAVTTFESWKFNLNSMLRINPQQGRPIRAKMGDTGMNVLIGAGLQMRLGFNSPVRTQTESGQEVIQFACDPSQVDGLFDPVNTLLQRKGMARMTREEFDARITRHETPQPEINFSLQMNMPKYYRALVKTAMAMAFSLGVNPMACEKAVRYLRDETIDEEGVVALPDTSLEGTIDDWTSYHAVTIFGLLEDRKLIGEVLYFGSVAGLVILSDSCDGPRIIAGHAVNLRTGEYVDADLDLPDLILPEDAATNLLRERVGRFKSPMLLEVLSALSPPIVDQ